MKGLKHTRAAGSGFLQKFKTLSASAGGSGASPPSSRLVETAGFGDNPGNLRMLTYAPAALPKRSGLVVALHGCTQTASAYDYGSGWSTLADAFGFAVLLPEQQASNNPNLCFNWFLEADTRRGYGEAQSIHEMIERMVVDHQLDRSRIFVVGLSAGGAMAGAMLASYPDMFAGGAIVAGLPYGAATNMQKAFAAMAGKVSRSDREWGALVRRASAHNGSWPKISIWHGTADTVVNPTNMEHTVRQWTSVHGVSSVPDLEHALNGHERRVWQLDGEDIIEAISIGGMGHGVPLASRSGDSRWGNVSPFHIEAGVSSSRHILRFWALAPMIAEDTSVAPSPPPPSRDAAIVPAYANAQGEAYAHRASAAQAEAPSAVIAAALKAAGVLPAGSTPAPHDPRGIIAATLRSVGLLKDQS